MANAWRGHLVLRVRGILSLLAVRRRRRVWLQLSLWSPSSRPCRPSFSYERSGNVYENKGKRQKVSELGKSRNVPTAAGLRAVSRFAGRRRAALAAAQGATTRVAPTNSILATIWLPSAFSSHRSGADETSRGCRVLSGPKTRYQPKLDPGGLGHGAGEGSSPAESGRRSLEWNAS